MFQTLIVKPLGYILGFIYGFVDNYGWSLVIFTVLVKLLLLPLGLKQQKATIKMQQVQPKMLELQNKYANDKQKLSEETMKLYKEYGVNPMGGCFPLLIQLPILFGLYRVIYKPLTFMLHFSKDKVAALAAEYGIKTTGKLAQQAEILIAKATGDINFNFLGLDLSLTPSLGKPDLIWLVPIAAALTTYLTSKVSTAISNKKDKNEEEKKPQRVLSPDQKTTNTNSAESMTKSMSLIMPLMTLWITFSFPATIGVYWSISNITSILQTVLLNGYYKKKMSVEVAEKTAVLEQQKAEKKARYNHKKR